MTAKESWLQDVFTLMFLCKFELRRFNLRFQNHYGLGMSKSIVPSISRTLIHKIRLTVTEVEGNYVLQLSYWDLLLYLDACCEVCFPEEYLRIINGPVFTRY